MERIQCYPQGAEFLANLLIHRHRSTPHYASSFIISLTYKLFRCTPNFTAYFSFLLMTSRASGRRGCWGVKLPTLLADTDTQPLPFLTVLLLHGFLSNMVFVSPKTVLIFYLTRFSLEKYEFLPFSTNKNFMQNLNK